jgi:hypothetical protein
MLAKQLTRWAGRWFSRWAEAAARARVAELETQLAQEQARTRVLQLEVDSLAAVVGRDRARVQAETAQFAREVARDR